MYKIIFKHFFDKFFSVILLIIFSPLMLIVIILLLISNNGKVFFFQNRVGKGNETFKLYKFKTMNDNCDKNGILLDDSSRLTYIGKFIRKMSLDELPQLINVIKGDMSLIGPRPLLVEYLPLYNKTQLRRHDVKPGITGWAQVNGRNLLSWKKKFEYDVWYVDNLSMIVDIKIIFLTLKKVFLSEGINSTSTTTMEKFIGN